MRFLGWAENAILGMGMARPRGEAFRIFYVFCVLLIEIPLLGMDILHFIFCVFQCFGHLFDLFFVQQSSEVRPGPEEVKSELAERPDKGV